LTRVVVVGDLVTDVLVITEGPVAVGSDTPATITVRGGGAGANTACWLARGGVDPVLVARVGNDESGRARLLELLGAGVDSEVTVDPAAATGSIVVVVGADGERTMLTDRGASRRLSVADVPAAVLTGARHLHLSGYPLFDDGSRAAASHALAAARAAGLTTSVDAASAAPLARLGAVRFLDLCAGADLLLANAEEAQVLTGCAEAAHAAQLLAGRFAVAVVKAGAAGAVWASGDAVVPGRAQPARVRDTTGAGDAFAAGLLIGWLAGAAPAAALGAGAALAAEAVTVTGGRPGG